MESRRRGKYRGIQPPVIMQQRFLEVLIIFSRGMSIARPGNTGCSRSYHGATRPNSTTSCSRSPDTTRARKVRYVQDSYRSYIPISCTQMACELHVHLDCSWIIARSPLTCRVNGRTSDRAEIRTANFQMQYLLRFYP